ncbi:MAG: hypothetical protein QQN41_09805, partial [Nitrosopumilus sp.]
MSAKKQFAKLEKSIERNLYKIFVVLMVVMFLLLIVNTGVSFTANVILDGKIEEYKEVNKPAKIGVTVIDCMGCSDIAPVVDAVKNRNVELTDENSFYENSNEAKELIAKYGIRKLPTVIITGEIEDEKTDVKGFELINDAKVLTDVAAPYLDVALNEIKGKVEIIEIVDSSCEDCISLDTIPATLSDAKVYIFNGDIVEYNSAKGKELISKYGIKQVPAILISKDIDYYPNIKQSLLQLNVEEKQGFYVFYSTIPPYRDLSNNKIVGLVDLIMLEDSTCLECYDVESNKRILQGFGIVTKTEKTYDISSVEGKSLISKYNIKSVPIIILSPEADVYEMFVNAWEQVGTKESDGWFVMR